MSMESDIYYILVAHADLSPIDAAREGVWVGPVHDPASAENLFDRFKVEYADKGVAVTSHREHPRAGASVVPVGGRFFSLPLLEAIAEAAAERNAAFEAVVAEEPAARQQAAAGAATARVASERVPGKVYRMDPADLAATLVPSAAAVEAKSVYDFTDLLDVVTAEVVTRNFTEWVVARFYEEAEAGFEFEVVRGGRPGVKTVTVERSPWVTWSMVGLTTIPGMQGLDGVGVRDSGPHVQMSKYTADDRGPGTRGPVVAFPLDLLFGERKRNVEYEEYLRLKAKFEGDVNAPGESPEGYSTRAATAAQALGLGGSLDTGYVGSSEQDRQP